MARLCVKQGEVRGSNVVAGLHETSQVYMDAERARGTSSSVGSSAGKGTFGGRGHQ